MLVVEPEEIISGNLFTVDNQSDAERVLYDRFL